MKVTSSKLDIAKQENGAWVENVPEFGDAKFKVRGAGNKDWNQLLRKLSKTLPRKKMLRGDVPQEELDKINITLLIETGLLDWAGLEDDDGKPIPYSKETAAKYLYDPAYVKLRDAVSWCCSVVAEEQAEEVEDDAGN